MLSTQSSGWPFSVTYDGAIATVSIRRASKRNALSFDMWQSLPKIVETATASNKTRVLVLRGEPGGDFSAGGDISEFRSKRSDMKSAQAYGQAVQQAADALATAAVPTVAAIEGYCIGGGCLLAVACDLRVASETARMGITSAKLGIVYSFHATRQLVELIGPGWARYLLLTGRHMPASSCGRIGLVHEVVSAGKFEEGLHSLTQEVAALAPMSQRAAREYVRLAAAGHANTDAAEDRYGNSYSSTEYAEGLSAFADRRKPEFRP